MKARIDTAGPADGESASRWFEAPRARRRDLLRTHGLALALWLGALAAARWYPFDSHPVFPCRFRAWTGLPCPTCGYTRGVQAVAQGQWREAARECPASLAAAAAMAAAALASAAALVTGRRWRLGPRWRWDFPTARRLLGVIVGIVLANWIWRLAHGLR